MLRIQIFLVLVLAGMALIMTGCGHKQNDSNQAGTSATPVRVENDSDQTGTSATPVRVAWTENQQLLTSDYQSQSLKLYSTDTLTVAASIPIDGFPLAVGVSQGKVFVGNETSQCVEVYSLADGQKLYTLGDGPGSMPAPNDLAIDTNSGRVFVADSSNQRVAVFSSDGPLLSSITDPNLTRPVAVALDEANQLLYVGNDDFLFAILVFTYDGTFVRSITGDFSRPHGLALDGHGHLFVADSLLGQVLVLDLTTDLEITRFGTQDPYPGPHKMPLDVVFDETSQAIYVSDFLAKKIDRYTTTEVTP